MVLVLAAITFITLDYRNVAVVENFKSSAGEALSSSDGFLSSLTSPFRNMWHGFREYDKVLAERDKLKEKVQELEARDVSEQVAGKQLAELQQLDSLTSTMDYPTIAARVRSSGTSNWDNDTVYLDKGSASGIGKGMPVIVGAPKAPADSVRFPAQLVGIVDKVFQNRSAVRLISDPSLNFSVKLVQSGERGTGHGAGSEGFTYRPWRIEWGIDIDAKVPQGDIVVTSGEQDSRFPADLPVGKVTRSTPVDISGIQQLEVEPFVKLNDFSYVRVLKWTNTIAENATPRGEASDVSTTSTTAQSDGLMDPGEQVSIPATLPTDAGAGAGTATATTTTAAAGNG